MSIARVAVGVAVSACCAMLAGCSLSDGPTGPIPGGPLRAGVLVSETHVEWSSVTQGIDPLFIELQLVEPPGSRQTGAMLHEGALYVPCDLGFIWCRAPIPARWMLSLIYRFKRWHEDALLDGRVVMRIGGKRYERQAVRVVDAELLATLRSEIETGAKQFFSSLGPAPTEGPRDIWFFRLEPRPEARPD